MATTSLDVEAGLFTCGECGQVKPINKEGGTGYGYYDKRKEPVCYECCGKLDREAMIETGRATLYLTLDSGTVHNGRVVSMGVDGKIAKAGKLTNWPGTLEIAVLPGGIRRGRHNIAGTRYDVWFTGPDGKTWHGVQYGENTQLCRCKRLKA